MIVLGIDPGFSNLGVALVHNGRIVEAKTFHKEEGASDENQMEYLCLTIDSWVRHSGAELVAFEQQWRAQIGQVASGRGNCRMHLAHEVVGVIRASARYAKTPLVEVTPAEAKRAVGLKARAEKREVVEAIRSRISGCPKRLSQHSADAVAIALAGELKYAEMVDGLG